MIISELNYLETVNEEVLGAGVYFNSDIAKKVRRNVQIHVDVNKLLKSNVRVNGTLGEAEAISDAYGYDAVAETFTQTKTIEGYYAGAYSESIAATNGW